MGEAPASRASEDGAPAALRALPIAVALLGVLLLWRGWGKWPDVLVDFGRELYVPWRLVEGERLGTDLAWFNGPLSPWWNALLFRIFGVGFWTLAWANVAWLAVVAALLHRILARVSTRLAAGVGVAFFLVVFACGHLVPIGNYNFVSPYSHEVTHGVGLALAVLACLVGERTPRVRLAGLLLGLVFLTKAEVFVAAAAGAVALLVLRDDGERVTSRLARLAGFALVPPALAFAALASVVPVPDAASLTLGTWSGLFDPRLAELAYYRRGMGLDDPVGNAASALRGLGLALLAFGPGLLVARFASLRTARATALVSAAVGAATLAAWLLAPTTWRWLARALPLLLVVALVAGASFRRRLGGDERRRLGELLGVAVFGLVLLGKIVLQVRFGHYGFALAAPAAAACVALVVGWLPRLASRAGGRGEVAAASAVAVLLACAADLWARSEEHFAAKTFRLGTGADAILVDARGPFVAAALEEVRARTGPDDTVLVLPEGVSINYFARRRTPTRYVNFMPPELILFGEDEILAALEARPPDVVVLAHKDTSEYGATYFGRDYARSLGGWVLDGYVHRWTDPHGGPPMTPGTEFGISVLERKQASTGR